jgi:hypothetical protein
MKVSNIGLRSNMFDVVVKCGRTEWSAMAPDLALRLHTLSHVSEREQAHCHARVLHRGQYGLTTQIGHVLAAPMDLQLCAFIYGGHVQTRKALMCEPAQQENNNKKHATDAVYVT